MLNEEELGHDDMSMIPQWQKEVLEDAKEYKKHDLILITPIPSNTSFRIMEDFADACNPKQKTVLLSALAKMYPFSKFRQSVERFRKPGITVFDDALALDLTKGKIGWEPNTNFCI